HTGRNGARPFCLSRPGQVKRYLAGLGAPVAAAIRTVLWGKGHEPASRLYGGAHRLRADGRAEGSTKAVRKAAQPRWRGRDGGGKSALDTKPGEQTTASSRGDSHRPAP